MHEAEEGDAATGSGSEPSPVRHQVAAFVIPEGGDDEPEPEQRPLRPPDARTNNRQRFQRNQRSVARQLLERAPVIIFLLGLAFLIYIVVGLYFYVTGWRVWLAHKDKPCDKPLALWLVCTLVAPLLNAVAECLPRGPKVAIRSVPWALLGMGVAWFLMAKTCAKTNPVLYTFVKHYLIFLSISSLCWVVVPVVIVGLILYGMMHGWFDEVNGASPDTVKMIETVQFDPALFAEEGNAEDSRPLADCCCCSDAFGPDKEIKKTPCGHYFHEECLGRWLRVSTTCPICRKDLEEAMHGEGSAV